MAKADEIDYIKKVAQVEAFSTDDFMDYLARKPFSDERCGEYLMDIAQVMRLLPAPPAKLLDVGVGSGWTSELFASRGYEVLGLDISPDMIELANRRARDGLSFQVCDYEAGTVPTGFDVAVIYDSLHHADDEFKVVKNIFAALNDGGILVTVEPGAGHSTTEDSIAVMKKYGTTEKDMPWSLQQKLMQRAGFGSVGQYLRLTQMPLTEISSTDGSLEQVRHAISLAYETSTGLTSIAVAKKITEFVEPPDAQSERSKALLDLSEALKRNLDPRPAIALPAFDPQAFDAAMTAQLSAIERSAAVLHRRFEQLDQRVAGIDKQQGLTIEAVAVEQREGLHHVLSTLNQVRGEFDELKEAMRVMSGTEITELKAALWQLRSVDSIEIKDSIKAFRIEIAINLTRKFRMLAGGIAAIALGVAVMLAVGFHWI
ncbi:Mg-protoporphyrin IX methyl transferase [Caballeronia sordidicola]|uniref:Mg-protoporphyrin IX methyl transferase n=1 Tax=Caballeronia sordidicola TaxID=196367 RepID=A0A158I3Y9_CABSO|nr:class I SAM-dependent methyltransferase [Caballeronia sordidicola]SAL51137.1 Mg-protoporphyrin IX methyl transferase [Caballeronia sordidicola]